MKALSLWQPWASLLAAGVKRYETRSWSTMHRGILVIHAAKHWSQELENLIQTEPLESRIKRLGYHSAAGFRARAPFGAIVGVVRLRACVRTDTIDETLSAAGLAPLSSLERALGNYAPGRFAWQTDHWRALPEPIPLRGRQGLFDLSPHLADAIRAAVQCDDLER